MERDEIYRRAMRAALAVTGRKLARVSLGICIAGSGVGCIEDANLEEMLMAEAMMADSPDSAPAVSGPDLGTVTADFSLAEADLSVFDEDAQVPEDVAMMLVDLGGPREVDGSVEDPDAEVLADGGEEANCLPEEGALTDWRCCEGHGFDRTVPGCTPCNVRAERSEWADCVTCALEDHQNDEDAFEEYMACCDATRFDFDMGCMAWGPPAPPEFDGRTLDELLAEMWEVA